MYSDITKRKKVEKINQELLEKEQLLTEELQTSNEELQFNTKELQESNGKLNKSLDELSKSESLLSSITNSSSDIIYIKDRQSRWIFVNPALEQFIGRNADELLGKNDLEIYSMLRNRKEQYQRMMVKLWTLVKKKFWRKLLKLKMECIRLFLLKHHVLIRKVKL